MNGIKKMGKSGSGTKMHVVDVFTRQDDGTVINTILCGAQQFNGSGNGHLNALRDMDLTKITCKRCLKRATEK
jgi:hypothetical protein